MGDIVADIMIDFKAVAAGKSFAAMQAIMDSEFGKGLFDQYNHDLEVEIKKIYAMPLKPLSSEKIEPAPGKRKIIL